MVKGKAPTSEGIILLQLRRKAGWTQARLERTARLSRGVISLHETGRRPLNRQLLGRLAGTLGLALEDVGGASPELAKVGPTFDAPQALTPASLLPHEHRAVEAAAERAAGRVRLGVGTRLIEARLRSERNEAANIWYELKKLPTFRACQSKIDTDSRFRSWALSERLCDESRRAMAHSFTAGRGLANLALQVASKTTGSYTWQAKVKGYALAFVANSLRIAGDLRGADDLLIQAQELWGNPALSAPLDGGEIYTLTSSLRHSQNRFSEARSLLLLAEETAIQPLKQVRLRLMHAAVLEDQGAHEEALATLDGTRSLAATADQPRKVFELEFLQALCLTSLGSLSDANGAIGNLQRRVLVSGYELDAIRVKWLVANVRMSEGRTNEALRICSDVMEALKERGMTYHASQVALDISMLSSGTDR